jgi:hypothetical protein
MSHFNWTGPQHKGAMKIRREVKRAEAEARNAAAQPIMIHIGSCGHRHGSGRRCAA